jgi:hypothetical protein
VLDEGPTSALTVVSTSPSSRCLPPARVCVRAWACVRAGYWPLSVGRHHTEGVYLRRCVRHSRLLQEKTLMRTCVSRLPLAPHSCCTPTSNCFHQGYRLCRTTCVGVSGRAGQRTHQ